MARCPNCQQVKAEHLKLCDLTKIIEVPTWKLEAINMDFVVGLPRTRRKHDSIWIMVDRLTKSTHFIPVKSTYRDEDYARLYIEEIVSLHGISLSIIYDRRAQFTLHFLRSIKKSLGKQVKHSTTFHPHRESAQFRHWRTY